MTPLEFAHEKIVFSESSPITGRFDIRKYRMLEKPLMSLGDIRIKRNVWFKASSAMGTVALQIALAYWLDQTPESIQVAMQSDDDAKDWSRTRGKKFILSIPSIANTMSSDKHAITLELWEWPHRFLKLTGPGENAQQGKQVTYFASDESHVEAFKEGSLASFEERMSKRWNRCALHVTTAPDQGKEVDRFYLAGGQNEFHLRCKCDKLIWPLWEEDSEAFYNGEKVFRFKGDDVTLVCPHCGLDFQDNARDRYALHENGDYVTMNPSHLRENESFRWSCFAAHWVPWAEQWNKYREALDAARLGNLQPHENFIKKRLAQSYKPVLPNLGEGHGTENYKLGDEWAALPNGEPIGERVRIQSGDYQAGKKGEGSHIWALVTEWDRNGNSRRLAWRRCDTWAQFRAVQQEFGVESKNVYVDSGYDDRTVFYQCSLNKWYATRGSHLQQQHTITVDKGTKDERKITIPMPYSQPERQNGNVGAHQPDKLKTELRGSLPPGWCLARVMGNDQLYGYLHALQSGVAGRYFGIASDMPDTYTKGFPAFIPVVEKNKKTNTDTIIWRKIKAVEHAWDCEIQALMGAMVAGCYPLAETKPETT